MLDVEQVILAALTGAGFGAIVSIIGSSWQRLALFMLLLWMMQTTPQYIYRWLDGVDVAQEVANVTLSRATFAIAACAVVAIANRYWRKGNHA